MNSNVVGGVLITAGVLWYFRGTRTIKVPKGRIGSNAEMQRLKLHYSAPCAVLITAGILVLLWA